MARRTRAIKLGDQLERFTKDHILAVRRTRGGEISELKHVAFGWIAPLEFYELQKLHDLMPLLQEFVRGGYQAKAWLWSAQISVIGIEVPVGFGLAATEAWNVLQELLRQPVDPVLLAVRLYALLGPFGDVIQIIDSLLGLAGAAPGIVALFNHTDELAAIAAPVTQPEGQEPPPGQYPVSVLPFPAH